MVRRKWVRMSVAAVTTGIMAISGYLYFSQKNTGTSNGAPVVVQLNSISTKELDEFIKSSDFTLTGTENSRSVTSVEPQVRNLLHNVSDKELDAFLSQVPNVDDELYRLN